MGLAVRSIILYIALRADYFQSTLQPIEIVLAYDVGQVRVIAKADYACGTYLGNGGAGMMSCSYGRGLEQKIGGFLRFSTMIVLLRTFR
jgi:hypothetical protein